MQLKNNQRVIVDIVKYQPQRSF